MQKWAALGPASGNVVLASGRRNGLVVGDGVLAIPLLRTPSQRSWHVRKRRIYETGAHHWHVAFTTVQELGQATHLGWEVAQPLLATGRWQPGGTLDDALALIELDPDAAIPMAVKRSAGDDGWTLRFFESMDQDRDVRLRTHPALGLQGSDLYEANLLDVPQDRLYRSSEGIAIPVHGFEIKTLLFQEG
jgi:alpha-mannosidase